VRIVVAIRAKNLARLGRQAGLCRLLRDEMAEQIALGTKALTVVMTDWRELLFPNASDH